MLQLRKERLARLGKLGQMAWRYHALKTRPQRLEACMRLRRLVNKYKAHTLRMARFARIRAWRRFTNGLLNIQELATMTPMQKWAKVIKGITQHCLK